MTQKQLNYHYIRTVFVVFVVGYMKFPNAFPAAGVQDLYRYYSGILNGIQDVKINSNMQVTWSLQCKYPYTDYWC